MTWEAIEAAGGIQWGGERLYTDGAFPAEGGRARLHAVEWEPFPEQPNREYPFVLNTGRTVEHWHTRTKTGAVPILEGMSPRAWLEMNPRDARRLKLKPHDRVSVVSARSRVDGVELRVTEIVAPGQVFMPFHYVEANSNRVTQSAYDPVSREPNFKQCAVKVIKTEAAGVSRWKTL
jgi:assimilatory nitrate reductase catalytic subunit